jgi:hypothetical protein
MPRWVSRVSTLMALGGEQAQRLLALVRPALERRISAAIKPYLGILIAFDGGGYPSTHQNQYPSDFGTGARNESHHTVGESVVF